MNRTNRLSAIVTSLDNEETIGKCLESILSNKPDEIIVVDGGSSDRTLEIASSFHKVAILRGVRGIAKAKDLGWRTARSELVLFLDADAYIAPDTVDRLRSHLPSPEIAGVSCRVACANAQKLLPRLRDFDFYLTYREEFSASTVIDCVVDPTICGLFRRSALQDVDGFDLGYPYAEDLKLLQKLREKGYRVLMVYDPPVYHYHREKCLDLCRQVYHHGIGRGILIEETKQQFYGRKNPTRLAMQYLRSGLKAGSLGTFLVYPLYRMLTETAFFVGYVRGRESARRNPARMKQTSVERTG
jgi:glycosyltransferase involved in cell wall biosynthesis